MFRLHSTGRFAGIKKASRCDSRPYRHYRTIGTSDTLEGGNIGLGQNLGDRSSAFWTDFVASNTEIQQSDHSEQEGKQVR